MDAPPCHRTIERLSIGVTLNDATAGGPRSRTIRPMRHRLFVLTLVALSATSLADKVPNEIKLRYKAVVASVKSLDFESFQAFFSPKFVSVDPKGTVTKRKEFMKGIEGLFADSKSAEFSEKLIGATTKNGIVGVTFEAKGVFTTAKGKVTMFESGTDYWAKANGKWLLVKTVDKTMEFK